MNLRKMKLLVSALTLATLAACGGGGGNPGTSSGSAATPQPTASSPSPTASSPSPTASAPVLTGDAAVASFVFSLDKVSINNVDTDKSTLTVTALDSNRNVVPGATVTVTIDSGIYTPIAGTTGANGQASGTISIGGDKTNRNINATINVAKQNASAVIVVVGSQLSVTPLPATPAPGQTVEVLVSATDSNGAGISGKAIVLSGTLGFSQTVTTNLTGSAKATLAAAPAGVGAYTVIATGLGVSVSKDVQVASGTSGIPVASGVISAASLAVTPNSISPNTIGSSTTRANLRAVFQNAQNQAVTNVRVRFEIVPPGLGSGEQISTGASTTYSDQSGVAVAEYIPGTRSSPTNGVIVRACYGSTDADIANGACSKSVTASLTVAGQPLSITLGTNNELKKGDNNLTYIKLFDIAVADAAGNPVPNAVLSASVDLTRYGKGGYSFGAVPGSTPPIAYAYQNGSLIQTPTAATGRVFCPNEDINRNGFLDVGEDIDGNGILFPRKADIIVSFVGANTTAANGRATIQVQYPQSVATWLEYSVRVTTNVAGSEGTTVKSYITEFVIGDDTNGSFLTPPYGFGSCVSPF
jgi:hypothetical protein